jgi:hypothetical protein
MYGSLAQENSEEKSAGFNPVKMVFDAGKVGKRGD